MRYGVYVPIFERYGDALALSNLAYEAQEAGWDGFFLWDLISRTTLAPTIDPMVDPWIALKAIALHTDKYDSPGSARHPAVTSSFVIVERQTVPLDHLSVGRLILGVGLGGGYFGFEALGEATNLKTRAELLDESLEVLSGL